MLLSLTVPCVLLVFLVGHSYQTGRHRRQGRSIESCLTPRGGAGVCIDIKDCPLHLDYLVNRRGEPGIIQYLRDAVCYKQGSQVVTCCPVEERVTESETCVTPRQAVGVCVDIKDCPLHLDYLVNRRREPGIIQYLQDALCYKQGSQVVTCCPVEKSDFSSGGGDSCKTPKQTDGQCINIRRCPELLDMLKNRQQPGVVQYLKASQCGFENNRDPKVCCPYSTVVTTPSQEVGPTTSFESNGGSDILPSLKVCGLSDSAINRVVNGRPANLGTWPWMVALGYRSPTKSREWLCGGSLISDRFVLTAAHCVVNLGRKTLYLARVGDLNLDDAVVDRATPIDIPVEKSMSHENYDAKEHTVDIALVKLTDRVQFTKLIRPICLPSGSTFQRDLSGYSPFVIGWGATSYRGPSTTALQEAQIEITEEESCARAYKDIKGATIDNRVICASSPAGKDACQGDSGGPLILPKAAGSINYFLIGVVSYGYKCAEPGFPGIYTKVSLYIDWIKKNMS